MKDSSPKKAVKKAKASKASRANKAQNNQVEEAMLMELMQQQAPVVPEVQAQQIDMQPPTINPYGRMGAMPANVYNPGNMIPTDLPANFSVNPEVTY